MKRSLLFLAATTVSLFGFSGQAMAYFNDGSLIQVVYQTNGAYEVATDLGNFSTYTAAYSGQTQTLGSTVTAGSGVFSTATWGDLKVAYFVKQTTGADAWTSGPSTGQTSGNRKWTGFQSATTSVMSKYAVVAGTSNQATLAKSELQSYNSKLNTLAGVGSFAGFIPAANGETSLANIGTVGYVDSYLYYYNTPNSVTSGTQVAKLRTYADGHTEVVGASPVPIPAPIFLLGSGLMALVGIKRKQTK